MFKNIFQTIILIVTSPQIAWKKASKSTDDNDKFLSNFLFPIFGVISIATFIGAIWLTKNGNLQDALKQVIIITSSLFGGFYISVYIMKDILPKYSVISEIEMVQKFVGFSAIILYVLYAILPLLSGFILLWLILLYSIYVIYIGIDVFLNVEDEKRMKLTTISALIINLIPITIEFILSALVK